MEAYLKHGYLIDSAPKLDEKVPVRESQAPRSGQTATGYGSRLPTPYEIQWQGKWRRVRAICHSNAATYYIPVKDAPNGRIIVDFFD